MSNKYEHVKTLRFSHRSEVLKDFMRLLTDEIPRPYLEFMRMRYGLSPDDLQRAGVRYLGGNYKDVLQEVVQIYGSDVLLKAGLLFPSRMENKTYLRFSPPLWKKVPLLICPGRSEGFLDQLIGFVPVTDSRLHALDISRWYFTKIKSATGQGRLIGLDNPVTDGVVILCSDYFRSLALQKHGYEALCISHFRVFKPSWIRKFGQCRVYVETSDAKMYSEELERVFEMFETHDNVLRIADTHLSHDYMRGLRKSVSLPLDDPSGQSLAKSKRGPAPKNPQQIVVSPKGDERVYYVQSSLL